MLARPARQALKELKVQKVKKDLLVNLVLLVPLEAKALLAPSASLDLRESMAKWVLKVSRA